MSNPKIFSALAVGMIVGGLGFAALSDSFSVFAKEDKSTISLFKNHPREFFEKRMAGHHKGPKAMKPFFIGENVSKEVSKIENGMIMTLTTEDSETLQKLQSEGFPLPPQKTLDGNSVQVEKTNIEKGIQIKTTSTDPETVSQIHEKVDHMSAQKTITRNVQNTDNGLIITITSTDPEVVKQIQEKEMPEMKMKGTAEVQKTQRNIENGVEITITSNDAETIQRIQSHALHHKGEKNFFKKGHGRGSFKPPFMNEQQPQE